jgi:hypothetical protein
MHLLIVPALVLIKDHSRLKATSKLSSIYYYALDNNNIRLYAMNQLQSYTIAVDVIVLPSKHNLNEK